MQELREVMNDDVQQVEIIITAALGGIVTVFLVIINLLSSVRTLRSTVRRLREELVRVVRYPSYLSSEQSLLTQFNKLYFLNNTISNTQSNEYNKKNMNTQCQTVPI
jgi:hypothetical protein